MLGYATARHALNLGRVGFFGDPLADLPSSSSEDIRNDDLTPQFGYVGVRYEEFRVLLLGINPGNGPRDCRSPADKAMMPKLNRFRDEPSGETFQFASTAFAEACRNWPVWRRFCGELFGEDKLSLDQVAYSNCLPWRTATEARYSDETAERAVHHYVLPLITELKPKIVIALYRRVARILEMNDRQIEGLITWNGARAPTEAVRLEREDTARKILRRLRD